MNSKQMAVRMWWISLALIVAVLFFPERTNGSISTDNGLSVEFGDVVVNEPSTIPLTITNESENPLTVRLMFASQGNCTFELEGPRVAELKPAGDSSGGDSLSVKIIYTPTDEGECTGSLQIMYTSSDPTDSGTKLLELKGNGVLTIPEPTNTPNEIVIGGYHTGVFDQTDENGESIMGMINECADMADTHGRFVRCVARLTHQLRWEGIITGKEKWTILGAAIRAKIPERTRTHRNSRFWFREIWGYEGWKRR